MKILPKLFILLLMMILSLNTCRNAKQSVPEVTDNFRYFVEGAGG